MSNPTPEEKLLSHLFNPKYREEQATHWRGSVKRSLNRLRTMANLPYSVPSVMLERELQLLESRLWELQASR